MASNISRRKALAPWGTQSLKLNRFISVDMIKRTNDFWPHYLFDSSTDYDSLGDISQDLLERKICLISEHTWLMSKESQWVKCYGKIVNKSQSTQSTYSIISSHKLLLNLL